MLVMGVVVVVLQFFVFARPTLLRWALSICPELYVLLHYYSSINSRRHCLDSAILNVLCFRCIRACFPALV